MKKNLILLLFIVHCSLFIASAQDTLLLMNGKKKLIKVVSIDENSVNFNIIRNNNKISGERYVDKSEVYALNSADGKKMFMFTDTVTNYYLAKMLVSENIFRLINHNLYKANKADIEDYINGERFAMNNYKPGIEIVGSVASGLMGGYLAFFGLLIPSAYIAGATSQAPDIMDIDGNYKVPANKVNDTYFVTGFKAKAKKIDFKRSFFGGLAGFTAMIVFKTIYSANKH